MFETANENETMISISLGEPFCLTGATAQVYPLQQIKKELITS